MRPAKKDYVLITEIYRGGKISKRTANGFELPISDLEREMEVFSQRNVYLSREEFEHLYPNQLT